MSNIIKTSTKRDGLLALKRDLSLSQRSSIKEALYLLIDCSGSMCEWIGNTMTKLIAVKRAIREFILANDNRITIIGAIKFSDHYELVMSCTNNYGLLISKIENIDADGNTHITRAIEYALKMILLEPNVSIRRMILLSDGNENDDIDKEYIESIAKRCKESKVIIDTIGFGDDANEELLMWWAERTNGKYKKSHIDISELINVYKQLEVHIRGLLK